MENPTTLAFVHSLPYNLKVSIVMLRTALRLVLLMWHTEIEILSHVSPLPSLFVFLLEG
jgi:hypothetical protein